MNYYEANLLVQKLLADVNEQISDDKFLEHIRGVLTNNDLKDSDLYELISYVIYEQSDDSPLCELRHKVCAALLLVSASNNSPEPSDYIIRGFSFLLEKSVLDDSLFKRNLAAYCEYFKLIGLNTANTQGVRGVLQMASKCPRRTFILKLLSFSEFNVFQYYKGKSLLFYVSSSEVCKQLIDFAKNNTEPDQFTAWLNSTDEDGNTALHFAARNVNEGVCRILINAGIDLNVINSKGKNALDSCYLNYSKHSPHGVINLLQEKGVESNWQKLSYFSRFTYWISSVFLIFKLWCSTKKSKNECCDVTPETRRQALSYREGLANKPFESLAASSQNKKYLRELEDLAIKAPLSEEHQKAHDIRGGLVLYSNPAQRGGMPTSDVAASESLVKPNMTLA